MESAGANVEQVSLAAKGTFVSAETLALLQLEIMRAEEYYKASDRLIPLLDADSRPAMRVLANIYHGLLRRVAANPSAVFHERVSVPTPVKLAILGRGLVQSLFTRGK